MKIQLKRSNVLEGGVAKRPTAEQMEYGELAVNYNTNDPVIFLKDSNNEIISIEINKIGTIDSGTTPPGIDNNTGDLFFDVSNNQLLFWNGSSWVPLNTNLGYTAAPTKGTITNTSGDDADLPLANATFAGLLSPEQYTKLLNLVGVVLDSPSNGLSLNNGELSADIATTSSLGTVKIGSGLGVTADGTISVTTDQDFLTSVNLSYIQESDHNLINNDAGNGVRLELVNTSLAGLMSPSEHIALYNLTQRSYLSEVDLSYQTNGDGPGRIINSGGNNVEIPIATNTYAGLFTAAEKQKLAGLTPGGGGDGGLTFVNLDYSEASDRGTVTNTAGSNAIIPLVNTLRAGLMGPTDYSKLNSLPTTFPTPGDGAIGFFDAGDNLIATFSANQETNEGINIFSTDGDMLAGGTFNGVKLWEGNPSGGAAGQGQNIGLGLNTLPSINSSAFNNVAIGEDASNKNTSGSSNTVVGRNALKENTTGSNNTIVGTGAAKVTTQSTNNTAIGFSALRGALSGDSTVGEIFSCVAVGCQALGNFVPNSGSAAPLNLDRVNTAVGYEAMKNTSTGHANTVVGYRALTTNSTGYHNTAMGHDALYSNTDGIGNTALGLRSSFAMTSGQNNTAVGKNTLGNCTTGDSNVAVGSGALRNVDGNISENTAVGAQALGVNGSGGNGWRNTAVGYQAGNGNNNVDDCTMLGHGANTTGSAQVQLGASNTTTYAYGSVQNRSDARDKTDVRDTLLGLDFIKSLRPVDFRWDYREDYTVTDAETGARTTLTKDGTRSRDRFHHGLIAQEVKAVADEQGVDFAGYQDHSINGGMDVLSIGYTELIAPLIKAVQELSAENADLKARIESLEAS